jgi:hypothetical protein
VVRDAADHSDARPHAATRTTRSARVSGEPYVTEEYGVRVDHELLRNVILTGAARFGNRDYETIAREDDYNEWELGADYMLNRNAVVRFRYEHDEVDSPAYRDYEVNQATLGLTLRL